MTRAMAAVALFASVAGAARAASAPPPAPLSAARVQGFFRMTGRVTDAVNVRGEHRGERITRLWSFASPCPAGACPSLLLIRARLPSATDRLVLHRRAPGFYAGTASFVAPARCHGVRYARGEIVPFRITVRVLGDAIVNGLTVATRIRATYVNRHRTNLTHCVAPPTHDAARYTGVAAAPPPAGATRSPASTTSSRLS